MYRHQLLVVSLLLAVTAICGSSLAAGPRCPAETIAASDFSLTKIDASLNDSFGDRVQVAGLSYTIVPQGDDVEVTHRLEIVAAALLDGFRTDAAKNAADNSSESHVFTVGQPSGYVSNGELIIKVPITYTLKAWVKFDWICCRRLKCGKCYKKVWTKVLQKTVDLQVAIIGAWDPVIDLRAEQRPVNLRAGDTEERLLHGLNKVFPGIQAALAEASSGLRGKIEELKLSAIRDDLPSLRGLSSRASADRLVLRFDRNFKPSSFGFAESAQFGPTLTLVQTGRLDAALFCEQLRPRLRETLAYLDSYRREPICETLPPGGSLYRLADTHYGNGGCHRALAQINAIRGIDTDDLWAGDTILVPPMHAVLNSQPGARSIRRGDNRWTIARDAGDVTGSGAVGDLREGEDPDLVFPCQYVLSANDDTLRRFVVSQNVCPAGEPRQTRQQSIKP